MINHLNSALIEGVVQDSATILRKGDAVIATFTIVSKRQERAMDDTLQSEELAINIMATGVLADRCAEVIRKGMTVRAVGRIHGWNEDMYILAQHIEYRGNRKNKAFTISEEC